MPRTVPCPTCHAAVPVPADPGTDRVCPECDEVIPAPRRVRAEHVYDPEDEEAYTLRSAAGPDRAAADRQRKADAYMRAARGEGRRRHNRPPLLGGPEKWLLVFGVASGAAIPLAYTVARRFPSAVEAVVIGLVLVALIVILMWRVARPWAR